MSVELEIKYFSMWKVSLEFLSFNYVFVEIGVAIVSHLPCPRPHQGK